MMTIKYYAEAWKAALKADKTAATIEGYSRTIDMFLDFLGDQPITTPTIMAWRTKLSEKVNVCSLNLYLSHVKYFCRFIKAMDKDFEMPDFDVLMPDKRKVAKAKRKPYEHVMTCEQVIELLNSYRPKRCHEDIWPRDKAILTMFLCASVRNSELCGITPADLDYTNDRVRITHAKGGEERYAAFPKTAQKAVEEYTASGYRPSTLTDNDPLFGVRKEDGSWVPFERKGMSVMVERKVRKIIEESGFRSHSLRHASASFMLTKNVPIDVVQQALGHQNIANTVRYAKRLANGQESVGSIFDSALAAGV